ncbi:DUF1684 domain-containing protein [Curtobacterium sp. Leaf261]|uniref:DUF1684 domain-containing protein n=1 Tax=Curtobacterium sp. Leaf261 TaxID=1736311 RepID=UPI0006F73E71|nr:DUF1684 domain-containing protein [Curtobacterium sp. Leaf261]KQO65011.1 hypothetical protein ASF23_02360 [Curtobacterium sp. Leaf261]
MSDDGDLEAFHAARERSIRAARGPLALVNAQQVTGPQTVWPVPGTWAATPGGLTVTASADDGVVVDDDVVDGTVLVAGDDAVVPSTVAFPTGMAGSVGRVGDGWSLRVWDPTAEPISRFARIGTFPASDAWVLSGTYAPTDGLEARGDVTDAAGVPLTVTGRIRVVIPGESAAADLIVVRAATFHGHPRLQLIFQDATSGETTYSMGRFLFLDDPGTAGPIDLDFNRAVLPPCAFSYQYACPIPPAENRLAVAVTAGETRGYDVDGQAIH